MSKQYKLNKELAGRKRIQSITNKNLNVHFPKERRKVFETIFKLASTIGISESKVILGIIIDFLKYHDVNCEQNIIDALNNHSG